MGAHVAPLIFFLKASIKLDQKGNENSSSTVDGLAGEIVILLRISFPVARCGLRLMNPKRTFPRISSL
jgi:hypothetical protein